MHVIINAAAERLACGKGCVRRGLSLAPLITGFVIPAGLTVCLGSSRHSPGTLVILSAGKNYL